MAKLVASRTLTEVDATWNATLIRGDVAEKVARLKERPGKNILTWGTGELDRTLVQHGLVDEFHFDRHGGWASPLRPTWCPPKRTCASPMPPSASSRPRARSSARSPDDGERVAAHLEGPRLSSGTNPPDANSELTA